MIIGIILALVCFIVIAIYFPEKEKLYAYGYLGYLVILFGSGLVKDLYDAAKSVIIDHNINITVATPKFYIVVAIGIVWLSLCSYMRKQVKYEED